MQRIIFIYFITLLGFTLSCKSKSQNIKDVIEDKNKCYETKLKQIQVMPYYKDIMAQFEDTFEIMKKDKSCFGVPEVVSNEIDKAVFLNKNQNECLLIILQRNDLGMVFGNARIIHGNFSGKVWKFSVGMDFIFDRKYFYEYRENSFENLSKLARYSVLTNGGTVQNKNCEIDEDQWFKKLY